MVAPNHNSDSTHAHTSHTDAPPPGSLEPLSPEQSRFLTQFFRDCREDLLAWSAATGIAIDALVKWLNEPLIAAYVSALRHHQAQAAKRRCIDLLTTIVDSDEPLPEKRRAATTLLRAIAPPGRAPSRRSPRNANDEDAAHGQPHRGGDQHQPASSTQTTHTAAQQTSTATHATAQAAAPISKSGTTSQHHNPTHSPTHQT